MTGPRWLYGGEPEARSEARVAAAEWLARTGREDDVLFAYEPTYLDAWKDGAPFGRIFVPRADPTLAVEALEDAGEPLGRGVWVLDASDYVNQSREWDPMPNATPGPARSRPVRAVPRRSDEGTRRDTAVVPRANAVQELGLVLGVGDAGLNAATVEKPSKSSASENAPARLALDQLLVAGSLLEGGPDRRESHVLGAARGPSSARPRRAW